jgi:hypothetical protein
MKDSGCRLLRTVGRETNLPKMEDSRTMMGYGANTSFERLLPGGGVT